MTSRTTRTSHVPATYQEGQLIEVTTVDVAHGGWCVARPDDGPVVFVRHALPGETVRAKITANMSERAATTLLEDLELLGPVLLRQVEEAQQKVILTIRRLEDAGESVLRRGADDEYVL